MENCNASALFACEIEWMYLICVYFATVAATAAAAATTAHRKPTEKK